MFLLAQHEHDIALFEDEIGIGQFVDDFLIDPERAGRPHHNTARQRLFMERTVVGRWRRSDERFGRAP